MDANADTIAFLSSLGANLRIPDDALLPSPISTPSSLRPASDYSGSFAPPSPILAAMGSSDHLDHLPSVTSAPSQKSPSANPPAIDLLAGVPSLSTFVATSSQDRHDALKLVADSVAQQRQMASRAVMSSPLTTALFIALTILVSNLLVREKGDWALVFTTMGGVVMAGLVGVRWMVGPYLAQAENIARWEWLGDDTIISTKYGDKMIGTLVLGWEGEAGKKNNKKKGKGGRGVIRAWTVLLKYRGKGEGRMLLEEAAKVVQQRNGDGLGFEEDGICKLYPEQLHSSHDSNGSRFGAGLTKGVQQSIPEKGSKGI